MDFFLELNGGGIEIDTMCLLPMLCVSLNPTLAGSHCVPPMEYKCQSFSLEKHKKGNICHAVLKLLRKIKHN